MAIDDFRLHVPDDVLADLRDRLARTRFLRSPRPRWEGGPGDTELRALVDGWLAFDWRAAEERLNAVEQHIAEVAGHRIHFARVRGTGDGPHMPLLLLHGWPSAFVEYLPLARLLSDSFDVVIPSLPGFVFSEPLEPPLTRRAIADALHGLMTEALGFERYATFGGDIGGGASTWLGVDHPDSIVGIQLLSGPFPEGDPVGEEEARYLAALDAYDRLDGGYSEIMLTRPDTIAAALNDSPAGLLAWIADKWHDWIDTASDGTWQRVVDSGILYTIATLYWTTESIGTSFQQYYDYDRNPPRPPLASPVGVYLAREPAMAGFPRSLAERAAPRLLEFAEAPAGGHFAGFEHPEAAAEAIYGFHARLREEG